jgi:hypothetical protein
MASSVAKHVIILSASVFLVLLESVARAVVGFVRRENVLALPIT